MDDFKEEECNTERIAVIEKANHIDQKQDFESVVRCLKSSTHIDEISNFLSLISSIHIDNDQNLLMFMENENVIQCLMILTENKNQRISELSLIAIEHILSFGLDFGIIFTESGGFNMLQDLIISDNRIKLIHALIILAIVSQYGASYCRKSMRILPLSKIRHLVQNDPELLLRCTNILLSIVDSSNIIDDINESLNIISTIMLKDDKISTTTIFIKLQMSVKKGLFSDINSQNKSLFVNNLIEVISKSSYAKVVTTGINLFGMMLRKSVILPSSIDRLMKTIFFHCHSKSSDVKNSACWLLAEIAKSQKLENPYSHLVSFLQNDFESSFSVATFNQKQDILYYLKNTIGQLTESQIAELVTNQEDFINVIILFRELENSNEIYSTLLISLRLLKMISEIQKDIALYDKLNDGGFIDYVEDCLELSDERIVNDAKELLSFLSTLIINDKSPK